MKSKRFHGTNPRQSFGLTGAKGPLIKSLRDLIMLAGVKPIYEKGGFKQLDHENGL